MLSNVEIAQYHFTPEDVEALMNKEIEVDEVKKRSGTGNNWDVSMIETAEYGFWGIVALKVSVRLVNLADMKIIAGLIAFVHAIKEDDDSIDLDRHGEMLIVFNRTGGGLIARDKLLELVADNYPAQTPDGTEKGPMVILDLRPIIREIMEYVQGKELVSEAAI